MSVNHSFPMSLQGEFIYLLQVQPCHAEFIYNLRTSTAGKHLNQPDNYTIESQKNWIQTRTQDEINYVIYDNKNDLLVGMVGIYECNFRDKVSNCGRLIISPEYIERGSPYGLEALKICYGYIFNQMGFRKISGIISGTNPKIIRLQEYLGMTQEGLLKGHTLLKDTYVDIYIYSMFRDKYADYASKIDKLLDKYR